MKDSQQKKLPTEQDYVAAKAEAPNWEQLPKRKQNALARDQMYHREYHELAAAIMGYREDSRSD